MEFHLSYFKSYKMMLWKCCIQYASKFWKLSSGHGTGKGRFSFQSQRKAMPKKVQTTAQLHSSHMLAKYAQNSPRQASTIRELWNSRCLSWFYKRQKNQRSNWQHLLNHRKSKRVPEKTSISALLTMPKPLTVWITINCGKFLKSGSTRLSDLHPGKSVCRSRSNSNLYAGQLELDMEQQTGSK